jgi:hypothetical protein
VVEHREVEAVDVGDVAQLAARRVAFAGLLDLDDVGADWTWVKSRMRTPSSALLIVWVS